MENEKNEYFDADKMPDDAPIGIFSVHTENNLVFVLEGEELIKVLGNGDIYLQGELARNDSEIVRAFRYYAKSVINNNLI